MLCILSSQRSSQPNVTPLSTQKLSRTYTGRVTYVIGKDGKCTFVYQDLADSLGHVTKALGAVTK